MNKPDEMNETEKKALEFAGRVERFTCAELGFELWHDARFKYEAGRIVQISNPQRWARPAGKIVRALVANAWLRGPFHIPKASEWRTLCDHRFFYEITERGKRKLAEDAQPKP